MEYFNDTPIIDQLRQQELNHASATHTRHKEHKEANAVLGREVPPEVDWLNMGWGNEWRPVEPTIEWVPLCHWEIGWENLIPRTTNTSTTAKSMPGTTGRAKNVTG